MQSAFSLFDEQPKTIEAVKTKYRSFTPRPYQQEAVECVLSEFKKGSPGALLRLGTGCHAKGQGILMFDGTIKNVEDVLVGDFLMGPDSQPRQVLTLVRGIDDFYEIVPNKGKSWIVNGDHILSLVQTNTSSYSRYKSSNRGGRFVNISVRDHINWSKKNKHIHKLYRVAVDFQEKELPLDPYLIGILLSDGCISANAVGISKPDGEIRKYANEVAQQYGMKVRESIGTGGCPTYYISNENNGHKLQNKILNELRVLGLQGTNSHTKFIPLQYKNSSRQQRLALLAGILDRDGCASGGCYDWISASEVLANDVCFIARSLGFAAYMRPAEKRCQNGSGGIYFRVTISGCSKDVPFKIPRRIQPLRKMNKDVLRTGFKVNDIGERGEYFGFTVDGDNLYLLDDFTVTHNCGKTITACFIMDEWLKSDENNRVIVIAHERQLIWQFADEIYEYFGERPALEMSTNIVSSNDDPKIIVASRATLIEREIDGEIASRVFKFDNTRNYLLIIDECHRWKYQLKTCKHILEWFEKNKNSRRLGLTATPSRSDGVSLARMLPSIAYDYPHFDPNGGPSAVRDGWCVSYDQKFITVEGLDFAKLKELAGDFDPDELEEILKGELERLVHPMLELVGNKQTLIFNPTVAFSRNVAQFINGVLRPDNSEIVAVSIDATTPEDIRKDIYKRFENKEIQFLSCVGLCREGWNCCSLEALAMFRPSKNKELVIQMLGRGCRTLKGLLNGLDNVEDRLSAINNSSKKSCLVIDLVGVTNLPAYQSTARLMAEGLPDEIIDEVTERVNKKIAATPKDQVCDVGEEVKRARAEIEAEREERRKEREERERIAQERAARRARLKAEVKYKVHNVLQGEGGTVVNAPKEVRMATDAQLGYIKFHKIPITEPISFRKASSIIGQITSGEPREKIMEAHKMTPRKETGQKPISIKEFDFSEAFGTLRGDD